MCIRVTTDHGIVHLTRLARGSITLDRRILLAFAERFRGFDLILAAWRHTNFGSSGLQRRNREPAQRIHALGLYMRKIYGMFYSQ